MPKPSLDLIPEFYHPYIKVLPEELGLLNLLVKTGEELVDLLHDLPEEKGNYRYDEGKWTIKEVLQHINDAERVFAYRALAFARNDKTELPGYDQDDYVKHCEAGHRTLLELIEEFEHMRMSTLDLFRSFTREQLHLEGTANSYPISVKSIGYIIAGHQAHHARILRERYLN